MKKIIYTILTIIWMLVIFSFSNQPADKSTYMSDGLIEQTIIRIYRVFDKETEKQEIINKYSHPVRKMAHFTIYLILGLLIYNLLKEYNINKIFIYILVCMIYACTDEIHQAFVIGRSCEIKDVLIDTLGSTIGILIIDKIKHKISQQ